MRTCDLMYAFALEMNTHTLYAVVANDTVNTPGAGPVIQAAMLLLDILLFVGLLIEYESTYT